MFNLFKWLKGVRKRRRERCGEDTFRDWYLRKLNNQDEEAIAEVAQKIAATRRFYAENPHLRERPTHINKQHVTKE